MKTIVAIAIEQDNFSTTTELTFNEGVKIADLANFAINEAVSYMAMEKMLVSAKNRAKLDKPFTFSISVEMEGKEPIFIPSFKAKISLQQDGVQKLMNNFPKVLLHLLTPKNMNPIERLQRISQAEQFVLA
jgi:hypothetical protein